MPAANSLTTHYNIPKPGSLNPLEWDVVKLAEALTLIDLVLKQNYDYINQTIGASPEAVNTIQELALAINNDPNFFNNLPSTLVSRSGSTMTGALNEAPTKTLASAATVDLALPDAAANTLYISGTDNITSFGVLPEGSRRILVFVGTPTIKYNAATLITPGALDILAEAGDYAELLSLGAGNWRVLSYNRLANRAISQSSVVQALLALQTAAGILNHLNVNAYLDVVEGQTLAVGGQYNGDTTAGSKTANFPTYANAVKGQEFTIYNTKLTWGTTKFILNVSAQTIVHNQPQGLDLDKNVPSVTLKCVEKDVSNAYWIVT